MNSLATDAYLKIYEIPGNIGIANLPCIYCWTHLKPCRELNGFCWCKKKLWQRHLAVSSMLNFPLGKLFNHHEGKPQKTSKSSLYSATVWFSQQPKVSFHDRARPSVMLSTPSSPIWLFRKFTDCKEEFLRSDRTAGWQWVATGKHRVSAPSLNLNWVATWPWWWTTY